MGLVKQLMMEIEEAQWEEGEAYFYCAECQDDVDGTIDLPVVYEHGGEHHLPIELKCSNCSASFDGWVKTDWNSCIIELDEYPDIEVKADPARGSSTDGFADDYDHDYLEWLEQQELKSRPVYGAFRQTMDDISALISDIQLDQRSQMLARMLLAQSITALEAFLADSLILVVAKNKGAQARLLQSKGLEIGSKPFKLVEAFGIEDFSKEKLLQHLNAVSFHNLNKVARFFQVGLNIPILPEQDELELIQTAIKMRHDCVHRNGVGRETGKVHQIDQELLRNLADAIGHMVKSVDTKIAEIERTNAD